MSAPACTIRSVRVERACVLSVTHLVAPTAADWTRHCEELAKMARELGPNETATNVAFVEGPGPNAKQRAEVEVVARQCRQFGAVVSSSPMIRGVITALSWLGVRVASYPPNAWRRAVADCGITRRDEVDRIGALALELERDLDVRLLALEEVRRELHPSRVSPSSP